jgi:hypothetical protein
VFFAKNTYNECMKEGLFMSLFTGFISETTVTRQELGLTPGV